MGIKFHTSNSGTILVPTFFSKLIILRKIYFGIDPGSSDRTGWAVRVDNKLTCVDSGYLFQFFQFLDGVVFTLNGGDTLMVIMEDPNLEGTTFRAAQTTVGMNLGKFRQQMQMAQSIGKNKGVANAIHDYLSSKKLNFVLVNPSSRKQVSKKSDSLKLYTMPTKCSHDQFVAYTGYLGKTNEHGRDAAMLIADITPQKFALLKAKQKVK